jgi:hypothetical protein
VGSRCFTRASQLDHGFSFGVARQLLERRLRATGAAERRALLAGTARDALAPLAMADAQVEGVAELRDGAEGLRVRLTPRDRASSSA